MANRRSFKQSRPNIPGRPFDFQVGSGEEPDIRRLFAIVRELGGSLDDLTTTTTAASAATDFTPVDDTTFAWVNQVGATTTSANDRVFLERTATAVEGLHLRVKALPTAPYTLTMAFIPRQVFADFSAVGMALRDSGSGKIVAFELLSNTFVPAAGAQQKVIYLEKWSDPVTVVAGYVLTPATIYAPPWQEGAEMWFQISDNATNRICRVGNDGVNWHQVSTVGNADYLAPDQYGFFVRNLTTNYDIGIDVLSLAVT